MSKRSFEKLNKLQIAELNGNEIGYIENGTFSKLNKLYVLSLKANNIERISNETFEGLDRLEFLYVTNNRIHSIEAGTFMGMPHILWLDLSKNKITSLNHKTFIGLNRLNKLNLASNLIRKMEIDLFDDLVRLRRLNMSFGELETIDFNAFAKTTSLKKLDLSHNRISRLQKMISVTSNNELPMPILPKGINVARLVAPIVLKGKPFLSKEIEKQMKNWIIRKKLYDLYERHLIITLVKTTVLGLKTANETSHRLEELNLSNNRLTVIDKDIFAEVKHLKK